MISEFAFATLVWGSLAIVALVFAYVLVATIRDAVRTRSVPQRPNTGVDR